MNYSPECDQCKYFVTTDKTPKVLKSNIRFRSLFGYERTGYCRLGYCKKKRKAGKQRQ